MDKYTRADISVTEISDEFFTVFAADAQSIFKRFHSANNTRQELDLRRLLLPSDWVNVVLEIKDSEEARECKPHARVCEVSTWAYAMRKSSDQTTEKE